MRNKKIIPAENETPTVEQPAITEPTPATFKHMANLGDVYASLAAAKSFWEITGRRIIYYQMCDVQGAYYQGATHPTLDAQGNMVTMNDKMFEMIKPLVEAQPYIKSFERFNGQTITVDLDVIRGKTNVNMPHGMLAAWPFYAFPDLGRDLSKPWIELPNNKTPKHIKEQVDGKIIINFTDRYRNQLISYHFLQNYAPELIFAGTESEHWKFCQKFGLNIPLLKIDNFLELAYAAKACRFVMANQSQLWNLCEAMKTPRLLEACMYADNCHAWIGENSNGYFYQTGAEYYFRKMHRELK